MSAFAVVYERTNTPAEPGVLVRVMEKLQHRGPDGKDLLFKGHAALGHWHFWTTPEEVGEKQPLQVNGLPFTIVLDGRLDNRPDLITELKFDRAQEDNLSDAALVLYAYDRWEKHCFEHFIGEFAIVIFDELRNELICARDALGERTLFYSFQGSRLVVASEPWAIANENNPKIEFDEGAIAHYFAIEAKDNGQSLFKNTFELLPAQVMVIHQTGEQKWKYWQPDLSRRLSGFTDEEYAQQFLSLLEQSIRSKMRSTTPVSVLMSGGLDSTSVASLAARMIAPKQLTTISYVFDELPECDERQFINAMVERWNIRSIQIPCDDAWPYKDWENWQWNPNHPEINSYRLLKERAYQRIHQEGIRVLLTGIYGDELYLAGNEWFGDLVVEGRFLTAIKELSLYLRYAGLRWTWDAGFLQRAAKQIIHKTYRVKNRYRTNGSSLWLTAYSQKYMDEQNAPLDPNWERNGILLNKWRASTYANEIYFGSSNGIDLRQPYFDRRLIEFVLALPGHQLYYRTLRKHILRNAMKGILPEIIRTRTQTTYMAALFNRGLENEKNILQKYIIDHEANWKKYVRADWIANRWNTPLTPENDGIDRFIPWLCLSFEKWNRSFNF